MAKYKGSEFLFQLNIASTWTDLAFFRSNTLTINGETVDVTTKGDMPWRQLLAGAGLRSMSLSGEGVVVDDDAHIDLLEAASLDGSHLTMRIVSEKGDYYSGTFEVTSFERTGEHNGSETFSISLESASEPTYTAAA